MDKTLKLLLRCKLAGADIAMVPVPLSRFATSGCGAQQTRRTWRTISGGITERSTTDSWPRREISGRDQAEPIRSSTGSFEVAPPGPGSSLLGQLSVVLLSVIPPDVVLQVRRVSRAPHPIVANRVKGTQTISMAAPASVQPSKSFRRVIRWQVRQVEAPLRILFFILLQRWILFFLFLSIRLLRLPPPRDQWELDSSILVLNGENFGHVFIP